MVPATLSTLETLLSERFGKVLQQRLSIVMYDQWIRMTGIGKCHDSGIDIYNPDKDRGVYIVVGIVTHMFVDLL